jgi:Family of unknown function (DUF5397)
MLVAHQSHQLVDQKHTPQIPTGQIKRFGQLGPAYQVGNTIKATSNGDWLVAITLIETDEKTEYLYSQLNADPVAI